MAHNASERYDVQSTNAAGSIHVPAVVKEMHRLGYNEELEVTLHLKNDRDVDPVSFTAYITANGSVTVPKSIRRRFDLDEMLSVSFKPTGERWTPDVSNPARKGVYESAHPDEQSLAAVTDVVADD